jgi:hypothetical protein
LQDRHVLAFDKTCLLEARWKPRSWSSFTATGPRNPITGIAGCCACAASGHAAAAPPSSDMNSRRFTAERPMAFASRIDPKTSRVPLERWIELDRLNKGGAKPDAVRSYLIYRLAEACPDILGKAAAVSITGKFVDLCSAVLVECGLPEIGIAKAVPAVVKRLRADQAKWRIGRAP